ncbi:MAG: hypothetical protein Ct9H300mP15_07020 [Gemmatimonadota bacterium]|nr:MAG: hypothetical protein Ct9H300mP15_07020 [Gemmatimonadota bacterium]
MSIPHTTLTSALLLMIAMSGFSSDVKAQVQTQTDGQWVMPPTADGRPDLGGIGRMQRLLQFNDAGGGACTARRGKGSKGASSSNRSPESTSDPIGCPPLGVRINRSGRWVGG